MNPWPACLHRPTSTSRSTQPGRLRRRLSRFGGLLVFFFWGGLLCFSLLFCCLWLIVYGMCVVALCMFVRVFRWVIALFVWFTGLFVRWLVM